MVIRNTFKRFAIRKVMTEFLIIVTIVIIFVIYQIVDARYSTKVGDVTKEIKNTQKKLDTLKEDLKLYAYLMRRIQTIESNNRIIYGFRIGYLDDILNLGAKEFDVTDVVTKVESLSSGGDILSDETFDYYSYLLHVSCTIDNESGLFKFVTYIDISTPGATILRSMKINRRDVADRSNPISNQKYSGPLLVDMIFEWYFLAAK